MFGVSITSQKIERSAVIAYLCIIFLEHMHRFDLAISYTWNYDKEFVNLVENIFQSAKLKTFVIERFNVQEVIELLKNKEVSFGA